MDQINLFQSDEIPNSPSKKGISLGKTKPIPMGNWRTFTALLFFCLMFGNTSSAQTIDGLAAEWPAAFGGGGVLARTFVRDADNTNDNQFTQGSQDPDLLSEWSWVVGATNNKGNISNAGALLIGDRIYFFGDRTAINGDASIGFWFFQNGGMPLADGTFSGSHVDGDLLIVSNFTNGGGVATITVYRWAGSGLVLVGTSTDARVNSSPIPIPTYTNPDNNNSWSYLAPNYPTGAFFEGFVDLGDLGIVNRCFTTFLIETRNSQSINASLQDFVAGAFDVKPANPTAADVTVCEGQPVSLTATCGNANLITRWYTAASGGSPVATGSPFVPAAPLLGTYYVTCFNATVNCESDRVPVNVTVIDSPDITVQNLTACEIGATGAASINLNSAIVTNPDAGVITFYNSLADAQNETGAVASPISVTVASSPRTFFVRAEAGITNCYNTASFTVIVTDNPDITVQNLTACEAGATGAASVNLSTAILTNPDGGVISFYNSLADAQNETGAVSSPISVTVASSPRTFFVRAEAGTSNCYSTASFTVIVTDNPDITVQNLTACETGATGAASVNLSTAILTNPDAGVISFYNSLADAQNETGAVSSPISVTVASSPRTFFVRAEAGTTNCFSTASFTVIVTDNPDITVQNLSACEDGNTGGATFNLSSAILTNPDAGVITFYNSLADAQNETGAVTSPIFVTVASSPRTFFVRAEAGTTNCYSTASFTVSITDKPDIVTQPLQACESAFNGGQATFNLNNAIVNADGGTVTFHLSQAAADAGSAAIVGPGAYVTGSTTIYVRSTIANGNTCYGTSSFIITVNPLPVVTCPGPDNAPVLCGVSEAIAQADADTKFAAWKAQFGGLNPGIPGTLEIVSVTYNYSAGATPPVNGAAPLILAFIDSSIISTSVTVTWTVRNKITLCVNSCSATWSLEYGCALDCNTVVTNLKCNGDNSGSIGVNAAGGTLPYSFYLYQTAVLGGPLGAQIAKIEGINADPVTPAQVTFSGLGAGFYAVIGIDATTTIENPSTRCDAALTQPDALALGLTATDETCAGTNTGTIIATFSGGTPPYTIQLDGGAAVAATSPHTFMNVGGGAHTVAVFDANYAINSGAGCTDMESVNVITVPCELHGCTPGFWQGRNNGALTWNQPSDPIAAAAGFITTTNFYAYFTGVNPNGSCAPASSLTMIQGITLGGGNCNKLIRHGIAAILNEVSLSDYPLPMGIDSVAELKQAITDAINSCQCEPLASQLAANNELNHDHCGIMEMQSFAKGVVEQESLGISNSNKVLAYPNPFKDHLTFEISADVSANASLQIYNLLGQKVSDVFNGYLESGTSRKIDVDNLGSVNQTLIYVYKLGDKTYTGRLIMKP